MPTSSKPRVLGKIVALEQRRHKALADRDAAIVDAVTEQTVTPNEVADALGLTGEAVRRIVRKERH